MTQPRLALLLEDALTAAAGADRPVLPVSLAVDYGAAGEGEVSITTAIDRSTKSIVFASARAIWPDGRTAGAAQGVFRVAAQG
jgi:hypothetical protein